MTMRKSHLSSLTESHWLLHVVKTYQQSSRFLIWLPISLGVLAASDVWRVRSDCAGVRRDSGLVTISAGGWRTQGADASVGIRQLQRRHLTSVKCDAEELTECIFRHFLVC